jgi:hypothetical protein
VIVEFDGGFCISYPAEGQSLFKIGTQPLPVAALYKVWIFGYWLVGIRGSNSSSLVNICILREESLRPTDPSYREIIPSVWY